MINFVSNILTEVTDADEMVRMLKQFSNEINELKGNYLARQNQEIDDVIEKAF